MKAEHLDHKVWNEFVNAGCPSAFQKLYDLHAERLYDFGIKYTSDSDRVKDAIHDLFIDLHTYRRSLAPEVNVVFYLLKSLKNKIIAQQKKIDRFSFQSLTADTVVSISEFSFNIEEQIIFDEEQTHLLATLAEEINRLPERQREILYLRFTHDLDYEEISAMMQISVSSCRTFVYRALKVLISNLEISAILLITWKL